MEKAETLFKEQQLKVSTLVEMAHVAGVFI